MQIIFRGSKVLLIFFIILFTLDVLVVTKIIVGIAIPNPDKEIMRTHYNCELRDLSYNQLQEFLINDKTNSNRHRTTFWDWILFRYYDCSNFARDVKANAIRQGIRCAGVILRFKNGKGHAVVAFRTADRGIIFIEPQSDQQVFIIPGIWYGSSENVIKKVRIFWPEIKDENKKQL